MDLDDDELRATRILNGVDKVEDNENWKDVEGYEGLYQVSNLGNIKSLNYLHTGKAKNMKKYFHNSGYLAVDLWKKGKGERRFVHKLVAESFIANPNNYSIVNHIDGNKLNNYASNLEWCTQQHNVQEGFKLGRKGSFLGKFGEKHNRSKEILQLDLYGNIIKKWSCASEVQRKLGFGQANIRNCCVGRCKTSYGFIWRDVNG